MINKAIINNLLENIPNFESLRIDYNGFDGHGINGVSSRSIYIKNIDNNNDDNYLVNSYGKDDKYQLNLIDLRIEEEYIYARYNLYSKNKYQKEYSFSNGYTMIIPYSSITSMCISPIQK